MPRKAREKSESGIYHVILRGINKQIIFADDEDRIKFIETLKECKEKSGYKIYAFCLMGNHIHLLIQEGKEDLGVVFKRIGASYVYWYNWKYKRCGHLFQDRYRSEVVESEIYFLTVVRYIHQNPIKAGLVKDILDYRWCSYNEFIVSKEFVDIDYTLDIINQDRKKAIEGFKAFHREVNNDTCLEIEDNRRLTDHEAIEKVKKTCNIINGQELQQFAPEIRNRYLKELREQGLSTRQLERLTGISRMIILKA
ncbi:transposase [Petroclostridium sp. X23]|uniref:transposase n=1 Tax=Petroclostridium sp. X23 TaxID=3045146 RepID=UPI0024AE2EF0|nr:transposase [Petroclostridium sp. X23]WHH58415.1 transposase [Petroclostridium sp. X23]